jgi:hypothetical protein
VAGLAVLVLPHIGTLNDHQQLVTREVSQASAPSARDLPGHLQGARAHNRMDKLRSAEESASIARPVDFDTMLERARAGDTGTACSLARDLANCANRSKSLAAANQISEAMHSGSTSTDARAIETVAAIYNSADNLEKLCEGITPDLLRHAYELQRLASAQGGKYSRWLAANPILDRENFLSDIDQWVHYRQFASEYFNKAAARKDLQDLPLLLMVYFPLETSAPRPPYREPSTERFLALYLAARNLKMELPIDITQAAERMLTDNNATLPTELSHGWTGKRSGELSRGLYEGMFPQGSPQFCEAR